MAITADDLQALLKKEGLKYLIDPERPAFQLMLGGPSGPFQMAVALQVEGQFLQLRTVRLHTCPSDHPHLDIVLKALCDMNYRRRLVKFGWDVRDGEVVAYADHWIMDGSVSQAQFNRMMSNFVPVVDAGNGRIKAILESGKDPGEEQKSTARSQGGAAPSPDAPSPELRDLLTKLDQRKKPPEAPIQEL